MSSLVQQEREKYSTMWGLDSYSKSSPGEKLIPVFVDMIQHAKLFHGTTVLDAGAGAGKGSLALAAAGFVPTLCDVTGDALLPEIATQFEFYEAALWDNLSKIAGFHDFVYCCDVLEHIPPAFTMLVIQRLLDAANYGVFLSISLVQDNFGVWIGETLHQTVMPFTWWRDNLNVLGNVVEARDMLHCGCFLVLPK